MVSGAVAGDDLESIAGSASDALGRPVAIALPALGSPVVSPSGGHAPDDLDALVTDRSVTLPPGVADTVPIRIGHEVVGVVAALGEQALEPEERTWLEGAAAAAAVTALMRESLDGDADGSRRVLIRALAAGATPDVTTLLGHARRLGFDLSAGAVAVCAQAADGLADLPDEPPALLADMGSGRVLGLLPMSAAPHDALVAELEARGMTVARSAPRRAPTQLHEALREAELLLELALTPEASLSGQEETYRLLIGVLMRDPDELQLLRERTVAPLEAYDSDHDTELVQTLQAFLAHHGSTTETADAMSLHRHTVGYRLSRVHEVSGLSPYESDGRERLSLGLKANQILEADKRRTQ
jgi:PucR C-terminal helix-turn-helix domain